MNLQNLMEDIRWWYFAVPLPPAFFFILSSPISCRYIIHPLLQFHSVSLLHILKSNVHLLNLHHTCLKIGILFDLSKLDASLLLLDLLFQWITMHIMLLFLGNLFKFLNEAFISKQLETSVGPDHVLHLIWWFHVSSILEDGLLVHVSAVINLTINGHI